MEDRRTVSFELITPEKAREILEHNTNNRAVKKHHVEELARAMAMGGWDKYAVNQIVIGADGTLQDGQHRLLAIVKSGCPQVFSVVRGADPRAFVYDIQSKRTDSDVMRIKGDDARIANIKAVAVVKYMLRRVIGIEDTNVNEISEFANNYKDSIVAALEISNAGSTHPVGRKAPVQAGIFCAIECGIDKNELRCMLATVNSGFMERGAFETPAILLRKSLEEFTGRSATKIRREEFVITQKAIHDYICHVGRRRRYSVKDNELGEYAEMFMQKEGWR